MAKVINMNGEEVEVVNLDEARSFFRGHNGECMKRRSFLQMIYRGALPKAAYTKTTKGNYFFDKRYLVGFDKITAA